MFTLPGKSRGCFVVCFVAAVRGRSDARERERDLTLDAFDIPGTNSSSTSINAFLVFGDGHLAVTWRGVLK